MVHILGHVYPFLCLSINIFPRKQNIVQWYHSVDEHTEDFPVFLFISCCHSFSFIFSYYKLICLAVPVSVVACRIFFLIVACGMIQFPDQGSNLGPCIGSMESQLLDHQETPCLLFLAPSPLSFTHIYISIFICILKIYIPPIYSYLSILFRKDS